MSHKNLLVIEQNEKGGRKSKGVARYPKLKKKFWSKLRRKSDYKIGFKGFEY